MVALSNCSYRISFPTWKPYVTFIDILGHTFLKWKYPKENDREGEREIVYYVAQKWVNYRDTGVSKNCVFILLAFIEFFLSKSAHKRYARKKKLKSKSHRVFYWDIEELTFLLIPYVTQKTIFLPNINISICLSKIKASIRNIKISKK